MIAAKNYFLTWILFLITFVSYGEGSKNLTPSNTGTATGTNTFIGYLEHDFFANNFLKGDASADERVYVHIKNGETLYWGLRRLDVGVTNQDLTVVLYANDGTIVSSWTLTDDDGSTNSASFDAQSGVLQSYAETAAGPSAVVGVSGYDALSYTNTTGVDQDFYIGFVQFDGGSTDPADDINTRSHYDLWDFSVYNGSEEKPGRMFCKRWSFSADGGTNLLSTDFQLYARVPSIVSGANAGNYVKEIDLQGLQPHSFNVYVNSVGSDPAVLGTTDFLQLRQSQTTETALLEYDIFISNPDLDLYPTTTLPTVLIADAVFGCNGSGGGQASIYFETNQVGQVAILVDLNGVNGYQDGTTDVIIEEEVTAEGSYAVDWNGLDGLGNTVASGTQITISGRFTSGPIHLPMWDVEDSPTGIDMNDVRPATSFNLIYWDDSDGGVFVGSTPEVQLSGTNVNTHTWNSGNNDLVNTWSFGYYQVNTQVLDFEYNCDIDGDGVANQFDEDGDNDGISDSQEGDPKADADADGIPNYLDPDFAGFVDSNGDGVNDNFDADLDGIPNAYDTDSDNDGIADIVEAGLADTDNDGQVDTFVDANLNGLNDAFDPTCDGSLLSGFAASTFLNNGTDNPDDAVGNSNDGNHAELADDGDFVVYQLDDVLATGSTITLEMQEFQAGGGTTSALVSDSPDGVTFSAQTTIAVPEDPTNLDYVTTQSARFIRIELDPGNRILGVDYMFYNNETNPCTGGVANTIPNTDGDAVDNYLDLDSDNDGLVDAFEAGGTAGSNGQISGFVDADGNGRNDTQDIGALPLTDTDADGTLPNYLDLDSDNDGITDNVEGQVSNAFITTAAGDTDGNGLLDVYDPNNGGTLITPVDTDSNGSEDYIDTDADGDGVSDMIEGHDANSNGFGDWDADNDNVLEASDFANFNNDDDGDGIWNVFDPDNGGTTAPTQNTDGADLSDFQDTDDDNDGSLTSGEDINGNNDWTDDFTQGQGTAVVGTTIPDYLFRGDYDGDGLADASDADSDNDGIVDTDEDGGEAIDPSQDADADGVPNYRDPDISGSLADATDANADGVYDVYDTDLDGIPDYLDLDSDNDGIIDAIEANNGAVPSGLDTNTGQFTLNDPDNDGLMNFVDNNPAGVGGSSTLPNADNDSDGLNDFLDIDSDADGITDFSESIASSSSLTFSSIDSDGDGIDDSFDPDQGGTLIVPVNTDAQDNPDYLDDDSDNDNVLDIVEGDDANNDGFGEWDANTNGLTDDAGFGADTDGDGLVDAFDNVVLGAGTNGIGTNADLQNTDGTDNPDFRDSDDDNDGDLTEDEDINGNGNYADDRTDGQGALNIPDYLYFGDFDGDGIADAADGDSDNDGIPDADEDNGEAVDPSADADADGIPNFRDPDDPGLSSTVDSNGDGVYDVFDSDLDGIPDFRDGDSDNDGLPDIVEAGGTDANGDGILDNTTDTDGDGIPNIVDSDNGGTPLFIADADGDGIRDAADLDSDGDGITDLVETDGTDVDGDGKVDGFTDADGNGIDDTVDGMVITLTDSDSDGSFDYLDVDADNDGVTDAVENGGSDTDGNGKVDGFDTDTDGDGLPDSVDPDNGGTPISGTDTDGDGLSNNRDLDSDNDGYPDILEGGGTDGDDDGIVDGQLDTDLDGIPDAVDVTQTLGTDADGDGIDDSADTDFLGGLDTDGDGVPDVVDVTQTGGTDTDGDQIDDVADVDQTGGIDTDGDGIDDDSDPDRDGDGIENGFDPDANGDGLNDDTENNPYSIIDSDGDGQSNFADIDSDNDGIVDVIEFGLTAAAGTGSINGFTDANTNGWNDTQETTPIVPGNTDTASDPSGLADYIDLDSDDDGIVDNIEAQTRATYTAPSGNDTDNDGLDDAYDPNNGGALITPVNTDGAGNDDYLDADSDGDSVNDLIEGSNAGRSQFADWDADTDGNFDDAGFDADVDDDGILDIFDDFVGTGTGQVTGSNAAVQDTDVDGTWDFQDIDDDNDGENTVDEDDDIVDGDPTNDFADGGSPIPDYLYSNPDSDGDAVADSDDYDADNDGLANVSEDGGTGVDPGGDIDRDGILNYQDADMDGDGTLNVSDSDADGDGNTDSFNITDTNSDGIIDEFDHDLDGVPDMIDRDSDNDGIADIVEFGIADTDEDGQIDGAITDVNGNGMDDTYDPCANAVVSGNAVAQTNVGVTNPDNAVGNNAGTSAEVQFGETLDLDMGIEVPSGTTIVLTLNDAVGGVNAIGDITQSLDDATYTNTQVYTATTGAGVGTGPETFNYVLVGDARYIRIEATGNNFPIDVHLLAYSFTDPCGAATGNEIAVPDADSDGVADHQDLDSDNDGITDNREAQATATYVAPVLADADGDGIQDVYDEDVAVGNAIDPVNTDGADVDDYLDDDSDGDGVVDIIEGHDANSDGFADWDTDADNDITDEFGYNVDTDGDGLWVVFDTNQTGYNVVANIDGSNQALQNTDGSDEADHRDTDDDNDGSTTAAEDNNTNGNWTDDFVQNGGSIPDYLFAADNDNDGVVDTSDADADNDGIPNATEYDSGTYPDPFADGDADGVYNYLDPTDATLTLSDANGDGVADEYDQDRDGIPGFFDLDSDNDGILDGIEANDGLVPAGFSTSTGRFTSTTDGDGDGLVNTIDANDADAGNTASTLAISDTDVDGIDDFLDIDSDDDGIVDNYEAQATQVAISGNDTDNDGLDDAYDGDNGGTAITPTNTESAGNVDYLDTDSDDDGVIDQIEGHDENINGFGDWDTNSNNVIGDETGASTDTDGDGLWDIFDIFSGRGDANVTGSNSAIQDSEGDGTVDFRDDDDDDDSILTSAEDTGDGMGGGPDGDWTNDKTQGGGATPDYLFSADRDEDNIADNNDFDADNDGIPNVDEYDGALADPFADADSDGLYNYADPIPANDSNSDGIDDRYDFDLDGVPNFFDLDSDDDGIPDAVEGNGGTLPTNMDTNGQYPAAYATANDADTDGVVDDVDLSQGGVLLTLPNSDGNGRSDYQDLDSDDDGIQDVLEVDGTDADSDAQLDTFGDTDGDGLRNIVDPDNGGTALGYPDTDGDGIADYRDSDADNDGFPDIIEAGGTDATNNGLADNVTDTDGDGWVDLFDSDDGGTALAVTDTDGDGNPNFRDLDSDNDLMPDAIEANDGVVPANMTNEGQFTALTDTDGDGFHDDRDGDNGGTAFVPTDTDGAGPVDYLDLDSDNDGIPDVIENGGTDSNGDGRIDGFTDTDDDGLHDSADIDNGGTAAVAGSDQDGDGIPNYQDADSDNDGISDLVEAGGTDATNDGLADATTDTDGDGWPDTFDITNGGTALSPADTDSDGLLNFLDLDADNDGIPDAAEANGGYFPAGTDDHGRFTITANDADSDGLADNTDGSPLALTQSDGDGIPDYLDTDSDGDGARDVVEAFDDDENTSTLGNDSLGDFLNRSINYETANGDPGHYPLVPDTDTDGVPDWLEDDDGDGQLNFVDPDNGTYYRDSDNDGIVDLFDSDQNGVEYGGVSGVPDNDGDTFPNQIDSDDTITLPVELTFFIAEVDQQKVNVLWQTSVEINNDYFEVLRSTNGNDFFKIGEVEGHGNSNKLIDYKFTDSKPENGINYYRLRQVDFDGESELSGIVQVLVELAPFDLTVYPNSVSDVLNLRFNANAADVHIRLIDPRGSIIDDISGNSVNEDGTITINVSNLNSGIYYLHVYAGGKTFVNKIIVSR